MIEWFARGIAVFLSKEGIINKENEKEICQYGIEVILANTIGIICILCISLAEDCLWQGAIFLGLYGTLRIYTGGYHANSYLKCNLYFSIMFLVTIKSFAIFREMRWNNVMWGPVIAGFLVVASQAPIENINKRLSVQDKIRYRKISIKIYMLIMFIMLIGDAVNYQGSIFEASMLCRYNNISLYIKIVLSSIVILMLYSAVERYDFDKKCWRR